MVDALHYFGSIKIKKSLLPETTSQIALELRNKYYANPLRFSLKINV